MSTWDLWAHDAVRGSTSWHRKSSQCFPKGQQGVRPCFWGIQRLGYAWEAQHLSTIDLHWIVFWTIKFLSKYDEKGKPRLSKLVYIPGGNINIKNIILLNPTGFRVGASLVYILHQACQTHGWWAVSLTCLYYIKDLPCKR